MLAKFTGHPAEPTGSKQPGHGPSTPPPGEIPWVLEPHLALQAVLPALLLHPLLKLQLLHRQQVLMFLPQLHSLLEIAEEVQALPLCPLREGLEGLLQLQNPEKGP